MGESTMTKFDGFEVPLHNWSRLPHALVEALPLIETGSELKVILYILRHTWGFQDSEKAITLDEFAHGRKRRDGSRLDAGTGLSVGAIREGLARAEAHGFIRVETDQRDKARVRKTYRLAMIDDEPAPGVSELDKQEPTASVSESDNLEAELDSLDTEKDNRTEKDTIERHSGKRTEEKYIARTRAALLDYETKQRTTPATAWGMHSRAVQRWHHNDVRRENMQAVGYLLDTEFARRPSWDEPKTVQRWVKNAARLYLAAGGI
jgi:DNA-binding PadR family transcriptional regulator